MALAEGLALFDTALTLDDPVLVPSRLDLASVRTRPRSSAGSVPAAAWARTDARSSLLGTSTGSSSVSAVSNSARPSASAIGATPERLMRARSLLSSVAVMVLLSAHRPQARDVAGKPCAWRCWASASRKVLAAA
jgi:hypothetical protein